MAVPKKRTSRSARDMRRAHDFLVPTAAVQDCPNCGNLMQRHHICPACGFYRGRAIFTDNDAASSQENSAS